MVLLGPRQVGKTTLALAVAEQASGFWQWREGMVIESLLACAPEGTQACFYRTAVGAEIDLVLTIPGKGPWAIEIKRSLTPKLERGFHHACEDVQPNVGFVVYPGSERYPMAGGVEAISLAGLCEKLNA